MKSTHTILTFLVLAACSTEDPAAPAGGDPSQDLQFIEVFSSNDQWTGVAASHDGRLFVCFPRWSPTVETSVAEIRFDGGVARGLAPYPDNNWNSWNASASAHDHFVCVQSVTVDAENALWILDPANPMFSGVVQGGAKLLKVDLQTNMIVQTVLFDDLVAPAASYLNDVRVDTEHDVAYITDSGLGALLVVDLLTGVSRRVLHSHSSTKAERVVLIIDGSGWANAVHSDGLALKPDRSYLYYQALRGRTLYRIATDRLRDTSLTESQLGAYVELVGETGAADGIAFASDGNLYLTAIEHNEVRRLTPEGEVQTVVADSRLKWPDSFSITPDNTVYVTTSRIGFAPGVHMLFKILNP